MIGRELAPTILVEPMSGDIGGHVPSLLAVLELAAALAKGTASGLPFEALIGKAVLHRDDDRAAQGVEPVDRVRADHVEAIDRDIGDEIPIDRIAEGFVDADAILIDRDPLRRA